MPILLVILQLLCVGGLLLTGRWGAHGLSGRVLETAGFAVTGWSVWAMGLRQVRVTPVVGDATRLVTRGPYRWVRHPMYTGVLLAMLALVVDDYSAARLAVWISLFLVLLAKLTCEERLLGRRFPEYTAYQQRTRRLLPFLFTLAAMALASGWDEPLIELRSPAAWNCITELNALAEPVQYGLLRPEWMQRSPRMDWTGIPRDWQSGFGAY